MSKSKTPLFFHFEPASRDESPVANEEFLRSYYQVGFGLRGITAYQQHNILKKSGSTKLERFAAAAALYQTLGMLYEDVAATVVSWAAWAKNRSLLLADIYERTILTSKPDALPPDRPYYEEQAEQFSAKAKSIRVCSQQFFESIASLTGEQLLQALGIPWKQFPSVKLVPKNLRPEWDQLPKHSKELLRPFADPKSLLLNTSYNKLKHGPQMVIMNPLQRATEKRGVTDFPSELRQVADQSYIRLLFDGARTQETLDESKTGKRVAPFLFHEAEPVEGLLITVASTAMCMRTLAWWLYRCFFQSPLARETDPIVVEIADHFRQRVDARSGVF